VQQSILFSEYNFRLINFVNVIKQAEPQIISDLQKYNLIYCKKINKDIKRIITHYTIYKLCNTLMEQKNKEKNILYFSDLDFKNISLLKYYDENLLIPYFNYLFLRLQKMLPIRLYHNNVQFSDISILDNGEKIEFINHIKTLIDSSNFEKFTFAKIRSFAQKNGLLFLNKEYFSSLMSKQLLLT